MGVLDELKREANVIREMQEEAHSRAVTERDEMAKRIHPRMAMLAAYLSDMADNLNVVDPDVRFNYEVSGCGTLKSLRQCMYRTTMPDNRLPDNVTFQFMCRNEGSVAFEVAGKDAAQRQRQYMWSHNLRFTSKLSADGIGGFTLEKLVPVTFEFEAQFDVGTIRLRVRNLEHLGAHNITFEPEQIDDAFLEELAKATLRKSNRFHELSGNAISEDARRQLQQKLAYDQYRKLSPEDQLLSDGEERHKRRSLKRLFGR